MSIDPKDILGFEYNRDIGKFAWDAMPLQFYNKPVMECFIRGLFSIFDLVTECAKGVVSARQIDDAEGIQLDLIGSIVGQSRMLHGVIQPKYFGFAESTGAVGFNAGGRIKWDDDPDQIDAVYLDDDDYRRFIRWKIVMNTATGTEQDIINAIKTLMDVGQVEIKSPQNMKLDIMVYGLVQTPVSNYIVEHPDDYLPIPAGVELNSFSYLL